jgi:hypothetical protein
MSDFDPMLTWVFAAKSSSTPFPIPQRRAAIVQFREIYFSAPRGEGMLRRDFINAVAASAWSWPLAAPTKFDLIPPKSCSRQMRRSDETA